MLYRLLLDLRRHYPDALWTLNNFFNKGYLEELSILLSMSFCLSPFLIKTFTVFHSNIRCSAVFAYSLHFLWICSSCACGFSGGCALWLAIPLSLYYPAQWKSIRCNMLKVQEPRVNLLTLFQVQVLMTHIGVKLSSWICHRMV